MKLSKYAQSIHRVQDMQWSQYSQSTGYAMESVLSKYRICSGGSINRVQDMQSSKYAQSTGYAVKSVFTEYRICSRVRMHRVQDIR